MHSQISKTFLKTSLVLVFFASFGWAGNRHHELNGTWTLVPTRSEFGGEPRFKPGRSVSMIARGTSPSRGTSPTTAPLKPSPTAPASTAK